MTKTLAKYRKLIAALVGAVAVAISEGVIKGSAETACTIAIAFLTALGVYTVPNAPAA